MYMYLHVRGRPDFRRFAKQVLTVCCLPQHHSEHRRPVEKIDGPGEWDKTHLNQCHRFLTGLT